MTITQVEDRADPNSTLRTSDVDLKVLSRHKVIPDFYETVGYPWWRRKFDSINIVANATYFDSTAQDVGHVRKLVVGPSLDPVAYIGDRDDLVLAAMATTTTAKPSQYWKQIVMPSSTPLTRFYLQAPSDGAYTMRLAYDSHLLFANDTADVDLGQYIPFQFHWALVELLKRELLERRFGDGDSRYQRADGEAQRLIAQAMENLEGGRERKVSYAT